MTVGKSCNSGVSTAARRQWTDEEERYLRTHRNDGADLLAHVLGRTPQAVRNKAARMGVSLEPRRGELCPVCGAREIREGSAGRHGMCPSCWEREKARAMNERADFLEAHRGYERAKFRMRAAGKRAASRKPGCPPDRRDPDDGR